MNGYNGDTRHRTERLLLRSQQATIVSLMNRIGTTPERSAFRALVVKVGGVGSPYGYLLLNRAQAHQLALLLREFLAEQAGKRDTITHLSA